MTRSRLATNVFDTLMVKDPDGNSIVFAVPKDATLAH